MKRLDALALRVRRVAEDLGAARKVIVKPRTYNVTK
jgi:hypothetical protein